MHTSFIKLYVFILITLCVLENSDCKQGGREGQQTNAEDFDFYYGACLSYGHSCWGAHGKRNVGVPNNPNALFLYRLALMQKSSNKDISADQNQSQEEYVPNYFNILKTYMQKNSKITNSDDTVDTWNKQPRNKYEPDGRYYEDQVLDPIMEYKLMVT